MSSEPSFDAPPPPAFAAPYAPADEPLVAELLERVRPTPAQEARIEAEALRLLRHIRERGGFGALEDLLHEYDLTTREGIALMVLAEALLRIPDAPTQDRLIEEKLGAGHWQHRRHRAETLLVSLTGWALAVGARLVQPEESPEGLLRGLVHRLGLPAVRTAARRAMGLLAQRFVLGETIAEALARAEGWRRRGYRFSFDMLGEGARTLDDADRYLARYHEAITAVAAWTRGTTPMARDGVSVKLSALHPRFVPTQQARVHRELYPRLLTLARAAARAQLALTIDAEEADRLELTLELFERLAREEELAGWSGLGLAVQAYQKRAPAVVAHLLALARSRPAPLMLRLVKGAYWDTEIKRAQERGLDDYPVFTRKAATDLGYLACARELLAARPHVYPMFGTHNAHTVAAVAEFAGAEREGFEFQRLHGMGEALYEAVSETGPRWPCRIYAPVGGHRDLLAYLVRRLLENGATTSFVARVRDPALPPERLVASPWKVLADPARARHPRIPRPLDIYRPERRQGRGFEWGERRAVAALVQVVRTAPLPEEPARPLIAGESRRGDPRPVISPIDGAREVGVVEEADEAAIHAAMEAAVAGFAGWSRTPVEVRAAALERAADLLEARRARFVALIAREAGRTLADGLDEVREAVDFLRYYAARARALFGRRRRLAGVAGEENLYGWRPRGPFVCISPWNFPLAIFTGQIAAALVAGNTVVAKPAEQTPLVARAMVALLHEAGVPPTALHYVPGDGTVGARLVAHPAVAGVAFTGSEEAAHAIQRTLAARDGPIVPLIAETGGINAMIVDASALPEQVADDVLTSAFRSAGQRCSALRLLCLQEDVAETMLATIIGATRELVVGDPLDPASDLGPVIDAEAHRRLLAWIDRMAREAEVRFDGRLRAPLPDRGPYLAPHIIELAHPRQLDREVFGPVLHLVRWRVGELEDLLDAIAASGFRLTLGIHSRLDSTVARVVERLPAGNVYVDRHMVGAVVGSQPFGGGGRSGTGFKAGGPAYLLRFAEEQVVTVNLAARGGNARLFALAEEGEG